MYPRLFIYIFIFYIIVGNFQVKHLNNGFSLHRAERSIFAAQIILDHNPTTRAVNSTYTGWVSASIHSTGPGESASASGMMGKCIQ